MLKERRSKLINFARVKFQNTIDENPLLVFEQMIDIDFTQGMPSLDLLSA